MSKIQVFSSVVNSKESKDARIIKQKNEIEKKKEDSQYEDVTKTLKLEHLTPQYDKPKKNFDEALSNLTKFQSMSIDMTAQQQQKQQGIQQSRTGECNLLPILIERLCSALEWSCSIYNNDDQLLLEDSGVDSEEDFRVWSSGLSNVSATLNGSQQQQEILEKPKFDLKFLQDILLTDIHTALARLKDTLKRIDIGTLTKYNASLNPSKKLYLLQLISNLLAKLKVAEDTSIKTNPLASRFHAGVRRRKHDRHTIHVSPAEIIKARRLFDKNIDVNESSLIIDLEKKNEIKRIVESTSSSNTKLDKVTKEAIDKPFIETSMNYDKSVINDKCVKDAINQHHLRQIKSNRDSQLESNKTYKLKEKIAGKKFNSFCKDDIAVDIQGKIASSYYHQDPTTPTRYNNIIAKKSKIKRANTIDIPNYLQLKNDSSNQIKNRCFALRRPIDVGDRVINGYLKVVPSFEPKTDNDRKFLALINKNTDINNINSTPFKIFNYHQSISIADKNWTSRFLNIKTNFDKTLENVNELQNKFGKLDSRIKFKNISDAKAEKERNIMNSIKELHELTTTKFTHASTSPFQKIEKSAPNFLKPGYISTKNSTLQAKLKMFDQEITRSNMQNNNIDSLFLKKVKFIKPSENIFNNSQTIRKLVQDKKISPQSMESKHLNSYPFSKQFVSFTNSKINLLNGKSNVNSAKSKILNNFNKDADKSEIKKGKPKLLYQKYNNFFSNSDVDLKQNDFLKHYSYCKSLEDYPMNTHQDLMNQDAAPKNDYVKIRKLTKKLETSKQSIAVQTSLESVNREISEIELIKSKVNISQIYPEIQQKKLQNNVSVQTNSDITSPIQHSNQNYTQNFINSNIISSEPHIHQTCKQQSSLLGITNISNYYVHDHDTVTNKPVFGSYYNLNYAPNHGYHQDNDHVYSDEPYTHQFHHNYSLVNDILLPHYTNEQTNSGISQKLYNEFSKLSANHTSQKFSVQNVNKNINEIYSTVNVPLKDIQLSDETKILSKPSTYLYNKKQLNDLIAENIQNQDISSDGVITRYTCALATVSPLPKNLESLQKIEAPLSCLSCDSITLNKNKPQLQAFIETNTSVPIKQKMSLNTSLDEIQRHNMLQHSLIHRIQNEKQSNHKIFSYQVPQEISYKKNISSSSPSFCNSNYAGLSCPLNESNKAQEKINLYEEKILNNQRVFRPLNIHPKVNVINSSSILRSECSPIRNNSSPTDSSEEYLISCANKPTKKIVLMKSESWHQLALARNAKTLELHQSSNGTQVKPPKPKSPSSLKLSKQFEASSTSSNVRKMEEKIQRYFQESPSNLQVEEAKGIKQEAKSKLSIQSKKNMNNLTRSNTMPHLYDDKLFDENIDIDKAFDNIFKEAILSDSQH